MSLKIKFKTFFVGATRLIKHLHVNNIPFALGTSSGLKMAELKMSKHREVFDLFSHFVMGATDSEVKVGKPAPDIFLITANRFPDKPEPSNVTNFYILIMFIQQ